MAIYSFPPKRRSKVRQSRRLLICAEGDTEIDYIQIMRKHYRISNPPIMAERCPHSTPESIVEHLIKIRKEKISKKEFDEEMGDQAWACFDVDEHIDDYEEGFNNAISLAKQHNIYIAPVNPSIELWLLLHKQDQTGNIHRDDALKAVKGWLSGYNKRLEPFETILVDKSESAIERAESLVLRNQRNDLDEIRSNPSCHFQKVIIALKDIYRKCDRFS